MFKKFKLKKELKELQQQILFLEQKRTRSEAAIISALLKHVDPADDDVDYFNTYTAQIDDLELRIREINEQMNVL